MEARLEQSVTYYVDDQFLMKELDHAEMVALSGRFHVWALYDPALTPSECTNMICWSADLERIAEHVGPCWRASDPDGSLLQYVATLARRSTS
jgi:hypothetical protein